MTEVTDLLDMQTLLRGDAAGTAQRTLESRLAAWRQSMKAALDTGVSTLEFKALSAKIDAMDAAAEVIAETWRRYHPTQTL